VLAFLQFDSAAEPLFDRMLAEGRLPNAAHLRRQGTMLRLDAAATVLQSSTYPTLCSGMDVRDHGIYSALIWSAGEQRARFAHTFPTPPTIWDRLTARGRRSLIVDPYLAWRSPRICGAYLSGLQFRDRMVLPSRSLPSHLGRRLASQYGRPPALHDVYGRPAPSALVHLGRALAAAPVRAAAATRDLLRSQPFDFLWVNFGAAHRAGHHLLAPRALIDEREHADALRYLDGALQRVYESVDSAIGTILEVLPSRSDIVLFTPTGMGVNTSLDDMLPAMLAAVLARRTPGRSASVPRRPSRVWSLRASIPASWRGTIARALPDRLTADLTTRLYAAAATRRAAAFVVPGEHKGYIRLNLRGREREGIVAPGEADTLMTTIAEGLLSFRDAEGVRVIGDVSRMSDVAGPRPYAAALPDLVVSWGPRPAASVSCAVSSEFGTVFRSGVGSGRTGNHADDAWAVIVPGVSRLRDQGRPPRVVDFGATACALLDADTTGLAGSSLLE
jgi:predicted AlkP superfamily phosphohydrolase/phosphomutase